MQIELIADFVSKPASFEIGAKNIIRLLNSIGALPEFSSGWLGVGGEDLAENEDLFIEKAKQETGPDAEEIGVYFIVAGSKEHKDHDYLVTAFFGDPKMYPTYIKLGFELRFATPDLCKRLIKILLDWGDIQHIKISDPYYVIEDSPLDARRRGIGWAGWVPFTLNREEVPEAYALEPLGNGTFLSCQNRWIDADHESIQRAQALELRLNSLGVLPTIEDLAKGNWGKRADVSP